jgi:hypothetical protein
MRFHVHLVVVAVILLGLNSGKSALGQASNDNVVTGSYHITSVTDVNPQQVKLSLQLRFTTHSANGVTLTRLAFHSAHPVSTKPRSASPFLQPVASSLDLKANAPAKLTQDVLVSRQEYLECSHGRPLHFEASVQSADGTTRTMMFHLHANPLMGGK